MPLKLEKRVTEPLGSTDGRPGPQMTKLSLADTGREIMSCHLTDLLESEMLDIRNACISHRHPKNHPPSQTNIAHSRSTLD